MATNSMKDRPAGQILRRGVLAHRLLAIAASLTLAACASPPPPATPSSAAPPPSPSVEVYFYPVKGQNEAQQNRDRYECYLWARKQTGFDPSAPQLAPHQRIRVEPAPPSGEGAAAGAITGAVLGAAVSRRGKKSEGAAVGAVAGAIIGAASDAERAEQVKQIQQQQDQSEAQRAAHIEQQASSYRRAMAACLKGRGYEVR